MSFIGKVFLLVTILVLGFSAGYSIDHFKAFQDHLLDSNDFEHNYYSNKKENVEAVEVKVSDNLLKRHQGDDENLLAGQGEASNISEIKSTSNEAMQSFNKIQSVKDSERMDQNSIIPLIRNLIASKRKLHYESMPDSVEGDNWKALAMSVYCGTTGGYSARAKGVIDSLAKAYPDNDWIVYVGADWAGWAYSYNGWDVLDHRRLCGTNDLLVFGREKKICIKSTDKAAKLLQSGAMTDAKNVVEARDLMKSREDVYDLANDLIFVYPANGGSSWRYVHYLGCYSSVYKNGFWSLWDGRATD